MLQASHMAHLRRWTMGVGAAPAPVAVVVGTGALGSLASSSWVVEAGVIVGSSMGADGCNEGSWRGGLGSFEGVRSPVGGRVGGAVWGGAVWGGLVWGVVVPVACVLA